MDDIFQAGAALRSGKLYVERAADAELFESLARSEFCHVLAPRQLGKTSLCNRAIKRLEAEGARCAMVEVLSMGTKTASIEQWYRTFAERVVTQVKLDIDLGAFWERHGDKTPVERLTALIREEISPNKGSPVVIVVDEIDALLSRPLLGDEFFGAVRAFSNGRATTPAYEYLTFCLVGVCAPTDLVSDKLVTPYNIASRAIRLTDFSRAELDAFTEHLASIAGDPRALLDAIFHFTEGHPYMTQALLVGLGDKGRASRSLPPSSVSPRKEEAPKTEEERVKALVDKKFLNSEDSRDANLAYAEERFKTYEGGPEGAAVLRLYRRLIEGERIAAKSDDPTQMALRLTGMAAERRDEDSLVLRVRNPIFAAVFDKAWVREREAKRLVSDPLARWQDSGRRDDFLPEGEALSQALAWAKGSDDLSPEECRFLVVAVEREGHKRVEKTELSKTVDLERSRRELAETEGRSEGLAHKLRDQIARERQRTLLALGTTALFLIGMITTYLTMNKARQDLEASIESDRAAFQDTLRRQREEFDRLSQQRDAELKAAKDKTQELEQAAAKAEYEANNAKEEAKRAQEDADKAVIDKAEKQVMAELARRNADDAKSKAEETTALVVAAKKSEQEKSLQYDAAKQQAEDTQRRVREVENQRRAKEVADAALQTERNARLKAEETLAATRTSLESERERRVKAEAELERNPPLCGKFVKTNCYVLRATQEQRK